MPDRLLRGRASVRPPSRALPALLFLFLLAGAVGPFLHPAGAGAGQAARGAFAEGNRLYAAERYAEAFASYRRSLEAGYASPELYLNLGNAAYRLGETGWAVYYFEQARRRAPRDPDIQANLAIARRDALGEEPATRDSALLDRLVALQNWISLAEAVWLAMALYWAAAGILLLSWFAPARIRPRKLRTAALCAAAAGVLLVAAKTAQGSFAPEALVVRPASAHAEPSETATVEFRLPAASPVRLGRASAGWREVIVSSSLRGWVREEEVAAFAAPR